MDPSHADAARQRQQRDLVQTSLGCMQKQFFVSVCCCCVFSLALRCACVHEVPLSKGEKKRERRKWESVSRRRCDTKNIPQVKKLERERRRRRREQRWRNFTPSFHLFFSPTEKRKKAERLFSNARRLRGKKAREKDQSAGKIKYSLTFLQS